MKFPIYEKIKNVPNHQPDYIQCGDIIEKNKSSIFQQATLDHRMVNSLINLMPVPYFPTIITRFSLLNHNKPPFTGDFPQKNIFKPHQITINHQFSSENHGFSLPFLHSSTISTASAEPHQHLLRLLPGVSGDAKSGAAGTDVGVEAAVEVEPAAFVMCICCILYINIYIYCIYIYIYICMSCILLLYIYFV